jgi:hypothetical protein
MRQRALIVRHTWIQLRHSPCKNAPTTLAMSLQKVWDETREPCDETRALVSFSVNPQAQSAGEAA